MEARKSNTEILLNTLSQVIAQDQKIQDQSFEEVNLFTIETSGDSCTDLINELYNKILLIRINFLDKENKVLSRLIPIRDKDMIWVRMVDKIEAGEENDEHHSQLRLSYNYLRIFYTYLIGAITIARIYNFDSTDFMRNIINHHKITTERFLEFVPTLDDNHLFSIISEGKGNLVNLLHIFCAQTHQTISKKMLNTFLDQAKDWAALEKPSIPVATIVSLDKDLLKDATVIILNEPYCQLTEAQKNQFINLPEQAWYLELSPFQQKLISHYTKNILSENCIIPSQLRAVVPLCKNAYKQTIIFQSKAGEFKKINSYNHSGTVAHLSKKNPTIASVITQQNLEQQQYLSQSDYSTMICLNSYVADSIVWIHDYMNGRNYQADDREIINLTAQAASHSKINYSKICLNNFRSVEFNDYTGIDQCIAVITNNLNTYKKLKIDSQKVVEMEDLILKIKNLKQQFTILDSEVKGLAIIYNLTKLASLNNEIVEDNPDNNFSSLAIWFGCASGENRTGITCFNNICLSIIDYLEKTLNQTLNEAQRKSIFIIFARSEHIQIIAGFQGSALGTEGVRDKSKGSLNKDHPQNLITKAANIKFITCKDILFDRTIENLELAYNRIETKPATKNLLIPVQNLLKIAKANSKTVTFMNDNERKIFLNVILAAQTILISPHTPIEPSAVYPLLNKDLLIDNSFEESSLFIHLNKILLDLNFYAHQIHQQKSFGISTFGISSLSKLSVLQTIKSYTGFAETLTTKPTQELNHEKKM